MPGQPLSEMDKKVLYWQNKGKEVPTRDLIKTPEQIEGIRRSGVVNTGCLDEVARQIHVGMNTQEIDDICMEYCKAHNAIPACLNYEGYPKSVCTSINEVVCHGIPKTTDVLREGDIVNVDMTTIVDGYFADASRMFIIGKTTPEKEQLVRVAKECLEIGAEAAKPYGFVGDIGHAVESHAKKYGYGDSNSRMQRTRRRHLYLFSPEDLDNDDIISLVEDTPTYKRDKSTLNAIKAKAEAANALAEAAAAESENSENGVITF